MTNATFTKRKLQKITIKRVDATSLVTTDNSGFGVPAYVTDVVKPGDTLYLELYKFNDIGGLMLEEGEYLFHRSDEYFTQRLEKYLAESNRKREEWYEANKHDLKTRTDALAPRYRARLERFLGESETFRTEPMGWGYELVICELAQIYERSQGVDNDEVMDFSKLHGTSGNQHNVARQWAKNPHVAI